MKLDKRIEKVSGVRRMQVEIIFSISSDLGTLNDFQRLCQETHKLGMKIILDMVFNHTSPDNVLLKEHPEILFFTEMENWEIALVIGAIS